MTASCHPAWAEPATRSRHLGSRTAQPLGGTQYALQLGWQQSAIHPGSSDVHVQAWGCFVHADHKPARTVCRPVLPACMPHRALVCWKL